MTEFDLIRRACETSNAYLALGNERWQAPGATFIRNRATPRRYDSNTVGLVRAESLAEVEGVFAEIERAYEGLSHRMVVTDALTPRAFETRLAMEDGYRVEQYMVHALESDLRASPRPVEIREVVSEDDWETYRGLDELWWRESGESEALFGPYDRNLHDEMMVSKRAKNPMARSWFALVEGLPRGRSSPRGRARTASA